MSERAQKIRLGLFVAGGLLAIAALIIILGKTPRLFSPSQDLFAIEFPNAPGIQRGTPVRRSGVRIGDVDSIDLDPNGKVMVIVRIDKKYPPRENEQPRISQSLLTGDSTIDFAPSAENKPLGEPLVSLANPRERPLQGRSPLDPSRAAETAGQLVPSAEKSLVQIRETLERFSRVAPEIENTLREFALLSKTVRETVPEIQRTNDSFRGLADSARLSLPELQKTNRQAQAAIQNWSQAGETANVLLMTNKDKISKVMDQAVVALQKASDTMERANKLLNDDNQKNIQDILKNVKSASENLDQISKSGDQLMKDGSKAAKKISESAEKVDGLLDNLKKTTQPFADRSETIAKNLEGSSADLQKLIAELRYLLQTYARSDGTVQRLFTDPTLYNNANDATMQVARLVPKLEEILKNIEVFADKIARHPEILGARGAIKPDSGLKNSPGAPSSWPR